MRARLVLPVILVLASAMPLVAQTSGTPLHDAAAAGDVETLRRLLDDGTPVDIGDAENSTALDVAAQSGHLDAARLLVESGADVRHSDNNGMTPLHFASYEGHADVVAYLIERGADVAAVTARGSVPLHGAALGGFADVVSLLLEHGCPVNAINRAGYTPIVSGAAGRLDFDTMRLLVDHGAYLDQRSTQGFSPLHYMAYRGQTQAVRYLLEHGANHEALVNGIGNSVLHMACEGDSVGTIVALLDAGARMEARNTWGATPLCWAATQWREDAARCLLERGADVNAAMDDGHTALYVAARNGQPAIGEALLDAGADPKVSDRDTRRTPLHLAALQGRPDLVASLLEHGADADAVDAFGGTATGYAAKYGHPAVVEALRSGGADCSGVEPFSGRPALLDRKLKSGEAVVWYLGHTGMAVRTKKHFLVFDYWQRGDLGPEAGLLDGRIVPEQVRDQNVVVFATHEHTDHFDPVIYEWEGAIPKLTYVFGFKPEELPQNRGAGYEHPEYTYVGPRRSAKVSGVEVQTIAANDAGVGFLVKVDGITLFHAGDHAGWADDARDGYFAEIDYVDGLADSPDIAFLNVTGCHAHDPARLKEGNLYALDRLTPRALVPTHGADREQVYRTAGEELTAAGATTPMVFPMNRGDSYLYSNGVLTEAR
jgi:ankyrin repeat protein/L-ascorbate metabolism protein UlaG (beta-lactamase superfamily)